MAAIWILVIVMLFASVSLPLVAVVFWRGRWRKAAYLPLVVMVVVLLNIVVGTALDPASHPLWPFELLVAGAAGLGFLLALWVLQKILLTIEDE